MIHLVCFQVFSFHLFFKFTFFQCFCYITKENEHIVNMHFCCLDLDCGSALATSCFFAWGHQLLFYLIKATLGMQTGHGILFIKVRGHEPLI